MAYCDLRHYLSVLEAKGKLKRISKEVDKAWEIASVCRRVFRTIPDEQRPALVFENVAGHSVPVISNVLGGSRAIYALAMETAIDDIPEKWSRAQREPLAPVVVKMGPVQENVQLGDEVDQSWIPIPTWSAGDPGPYHTGPCIVSRHPDTGERNVGTYRLQRVDHKTVYMNLSNPTRHIFPHMAANEARNRPTDVAIFFGGEPAINLCSALPVPYEVDDYGVAGAIRGEPLELVKCLTVDVEVPATAEIVLEGKVRPNVRVQEGPFGEYTGYLSEDNLEGFAIDITAITWRNNPLYQVFMSQMPPSESSVIRSTGCGTAMRKYLAQDLRLPVTDCDFTHAGGAWATLVISMKKQRPQQPQEVMWAAMGFDTRMSKIIVVVDDDIDVRDPFQVEWATAWHMQPHRDVYVFRDTEPVDLDPSVAPYDVPSDRRRRTPVSKVGIDATRKHAYPPLAVPSKEALRRVDEQWDLYGID